MRSVYYPKNRITLRGTQVRIFIAKELPCLGQFPSLPCICFLELASEGLTFPFSL